MVLSAKLVITVLPERSRSITNRTRPTYHSHRQCPCPLTVETAHFHIHAKNRGRSLNVATTSDDDSDFTGGTTPASDNAVSVSYATADGTASAASGTVTFAAGETSKTVSVLIIDNTVDESDETLTLTLSNPSGGTISDADADATATITGSEPVPLTATLFNVPASHDGSSTFTFDLAFSENVRAGYARIRDHAFTIDEGDIEKAQRKVQGSNRTWTIEV